MKKNLELLETLTAHICHELAGSIGTIDNCLSLMDTKDEPISQQAKLLADEESSNLIRKIQIFRECYGFSQGKQEMSTIDLNRLLKDLFVNNNIQFTIHFEDEILCLNSLLAKIVMCLVTIAKGHIKNGKMDLSFKKDNTIKIAVSGAGVGLRKDNFWRADNGAKTPVTVANIRQHYINMMCDLVDYKIAVIQKKNAIEYNLTKSQ